MTNTNKNILQEIKIIILQKLFNSSGKGDSFIYPNEKNLKLLQHFKYGQKINIDKIKLDIPKTCNQYIKIYSFRMVELLLIKKSKKMLDKCDIYLTSTYFKGTKVYKSFEELPNRRGYGIVIFKINVRY